MTTMRILSQVLLVKGSLKVLLKGSFQESVGALWYSLLNLEHLPKPFLRLLTKTILLYTTVLLIRALFV